jgi:hypothetical protein
MGEGFDAESEAAVFDSWGRFARTNPGTPTVDLERLREKFGRDQDNLWGRMSYSLSDLPIDRINRKRGIITFLAIMGAVDWLLTIVILAAHDWNVGQTFGIRNFIGLPLWGAFCLYGIVHFYRRHSRLLIDEKGVRLTVDGKTKMYAWSDIGRVRKVVADRNGDTAVQIVRKGQILPDNKSDLIWGEFGISMDDLLTLIRAGQTEWGTGEEVSA